MGFILDFANVCILVPSIDKVLPPNGRRADHGERDGPEESVSAVQLHNAEDDDPDQLRHQAQKVQKEFHPAVRFAAVPG